MTEERQPRSFRRIAGEPGTPLVLLCDHASNHIPAAYGQLGIAAGELQRHIAYDIGAAALTERLAGRLRACALLTTYSRLLIDPNRGIDDPTLIMKLSDGVVIPGNRNIDETERQHRIDTYHRPYHAAIAEEIDRIIADAGPPLLVSIHSFTPAWKGHSRPWHVGILWDRDERLARFLLMRLGQEQGLVVGDNEPYHGALEGDTLNVHGTRRGLPHVLIEIRQDLIADESGVDDWSRRLATILEDAMKKVVRPMPDRACHG